MDGVSRREKKDKFSETYVENKINKRETQRSRSHKFIKPWKCNIPGDVVEGSFSCKPVQNEECRIYAHLSTINAPLGPQVIPINSRSHN